MTIEVNVPVLPESVADATVAKWYKQPGDAVSRDENLVDLETDKVMLEVPAPADGVLGEILKPEGSTVVANELIAKMEEGSAPVAKPEAKKEAKAAPAPEKASAASMDKLSPSVRRLVSENSLDISKIQGSGKDGRILKEDVEAFMKGGAEPQTKAVPAMPTGERLEKRVPMTRLRARIAERLVQVQQETAMLTTFNEVNMKPVMDLRAKYKESFEKTHGVRLGFMSFFIKASIEALKRFPSVNASIDGNDILYHDYFDVGVAVSTPRGLVVPILRDAQNMSMAGIEGGIVEYATRAKNGKLTIEEMTGGTFTITNGGVFGSMLSTPILNSPQSAILGMHNIVKRAVVENDEIVIRPMMYLALSYDHRIVDGKESVSFLRTVKELLEDPARMMMQV